MKLICLVILVLCPMAGASLDRVLPTGRRCGLKYNMLLQDRDWVCNDPKYKNYPGLKVQDAVYSGLYPDIAKYLNITKNCQTYHDHLDIHGSNTYYSYSSLCRMRRNPVRVVWARVPGYAPKPNENLLHQGLLPVHVLEGQSLYDIYCVHPWSDGGNLSYLAPRMQKVAKRVNWTGVKRHLCKVGYMYNNNYICKPSGFINREVVVYSEHANMLFKLRIPNVPTACSCTKCECTGLPVFRG